jgi:hypothetical protein
MVVHFARFFRAFCTIDEDFMSILLRILRILAIIAPLLVGICVMLVMLLLELVLAVNNMFLQQLNDLFIGWGLESMAVFRKPQDPPED